MGAFGFNLGFTFAENWAVMFLGLYNVFRGGFEEKTNIPEIEYSSVTTYDAINLTDVYSGVKGSANTLGIGLGYGYEGKFWGGALTGFFQFFGGYFQSNSKYTQTMTRTNDDTGEVTLDMDMEASPSQSGTFMGLLYELRFGKSQSWGLTYFFNMMFGISGGCTEYEAKNVRVDTDGRSGAGNCAGKPEGTIRVDLLEAATIGINLLIGKHISINVSAPFWGNNPFDNVYPTGAKTKNYSVTISF